MVSIKTWVFTHAEYGIQNLSMGTGQWLASFTLALVNIPLLPRKTMVGEHTLTLLVDQFVICRTTQMRINLQEKNRASYGD
jgi:hypothetical protein